MSHKLTNEEFDERIKNFKIKRMENYQGKNTKISFKCLICGKTFRTTPNGMLYGNNCKNGCESCAKEYGYEQIRKQKGITDEEIDSRIKNFNIVRIGHIKNNIREEITFKCKICGKLFEQSIDVVLSGHGVYGCPSCSMEHGCAKRRLSTNEVQDKLKLKNIKLIGNYLGSSKHHDLECNICGYKWNTTLTQYLHGNHACPNCSNINIGGEKYMKSILDELQIKYETQKTFDNLKDSILLRFDFYLPQYNLLIEIDGEQHFRVAKFSKQLTEEQCEKSFQILQNHDSLKNKYCSENNINLLRIPWKVSKKYSKISIIDDKEKLKNYFISELSKYN